MLGAELERSQAQGVSLLEVGLGRLKVHVQDRAAVRRSGVGQCELGIELDSALEHAPCELNLLFAELMEELTAPEV